ncbi:unnamed protein product, partial [Ectocarpus sp. 12 AP-2014]
AVSGGSGCHNPLHTYDSCRGGGGIIDTSQQPSSHGKRCIPYSRLHVLKTSFPKPKINSMDVSASFRLLLYFIYSTSCPKQKNQHHGSAPFRLLFYFTILLVVRPFHIQKRTPRIMHEVTCMWYLEEQFYRAEVAHLARH